MRTVENKFATIGAFKEDRPRRIREFSRIVEVFKPTVHRIIDKNRLQATFTP